MVGLNERSLAFPPGRWRARWIWADPASASSAVAERHAVALRHVFSLDVVPDSVPGRAMALARYVLWVNGVEVARGPVRANPRRAAYDDFDLAPHLRAGVNVVAVLAQRYAGPTPWYLPPPELANDLGRGAFVLEADLGGGRWLATDEAWRGTVLEGWTATPGVGVSGRGIEQVDGRSLPPAWNAAEPGGAVEGWPAVLLRRASTTGEPGDPRPPSYPVGPLHRRPISWPTVEPVALVEQGSGRFVAPRIVAGTLALSARGPAGATVLVRAAEFLDADGIPAPGGEDAAVRFTLDDSGRPLESLDVYGLRGALVEADEGVEVTELRVDERLHPLVGEGAFECSDADLNRIWAVGRRTVTLCSMDAYLDCPTREQRAWTGDSVVHQMVDLTTNSDWTLARWHPRLAASPRPDGMLPMACAGDAEWADFTIIPDWALHWVHSVWNLHRYVGDAAEVAALLPVVEGVLRWFEPFCDDHGVPVDVYGWVIIDWSSVYTAGTSAALCGLWARGLLELAEMARWLGDEGRARWAREAHERLRAGFERMWDPQRRRYRDSLVAGQDRPMASQHAQAAAIVGALAPPERWERLVEVITDEAHLVHATFSVPDGPAGPGAEAPVGGAYLRDGHPEPWWDVDRQVVRAQPFFRYVVHDALVAAGRADLVPGLLRDWTAALDRCDSSLTETWFGGTVSHGWSATPTRDLVQRVLGVTPAEPGFTVASVQPELGGLEWARGTVPTPAGPLRLDVRPGRLEVDSPLPFTCDGEDRPPGLYEIVRSNTIRT